MIKCAICGKTMQKMTPAHLAHKHAGMTTDQYYAQHGQPEEVPDEPVAHPLDKELTTVEAGMLSADQKQFALELIQGKSKGEAMEAIGKSTSLMYTRPWKEVMPIIEAITARLLAEPLLAAHATILAGSKQAAEEMVSLTRDPDPRVRLHASSDILDRSGLSRRPKNSIDVEMLKNMTNEELDRQIAQMLEAEQEREEAIDGDFQVINEDQPFTGREWRNRAFNWYWHTLRPERQFDSLEDLKIRHAFHLEDIYGKSITREEAEKVLEEHGIDWKEVPPE
jgi:hypothetical protein